MRWTGRFNFLYYALFDTAHTEDHLHDGITFLDVTDTEFLEAVICRYSRNSEIKKECIVFLEITFQQVIF